MELRVLNYFLMVVREENITKATQHLKKRNWSFSIMRTSLPERFPLVVGKRGGGDLTILLLGLAFHCFCLENKKSLCHSLGRSSRSDFVQYEFVRMPFKERWGILVRNDSSLAKKSAVTSEDLQDVPLIMVHRELVKNELANWLGDSFEHLEIAATYNVILNGAVLCFEFGVFFENLCFILLEPHMETGSVLVWKKNQTLSTAHAKFVQHIKE